jgi:16S rRNA (uracil1498-N3)-methyltransferase
MKMEWFYCEDLKSDSKHIAIIEEEYKHIKAHRIKVNEKIIITDGKGLAFECRIINLSKRDCLIELLNPIEEQMSAHRKITLAMPILDNRERFEFALEKGTELGISNFIPLITKYSSKKPLNQARLKAKAISTIKQCQRATLPTISNAIDISELIEAIPNNQYIIVADINGIKPKNNIIEKDILLIVGPEGGLSDKELDMLSRKSKVSFWKLGNTRLRAETSAIVLMGLVNSM